MKDIDKLLKGYIKHAGESERKVALSLGINPSQFNKWVQGINVPYSQTMDKLISTNKDFRNYVEKFRQAQSEATNENSGQSLHPIPFYDNVVATGGKVSTLNDNESASTIHLGDLFRDATGSMAVHGDSMYPNYESGCIVGFREIKDRSIIAYGEVYIIVTADMCLIKRINKSIDEDKFIIASSINERFPPFDIARDKIRGLYLVLGKISRSAMAKINF